MNPKPVQSAPGQCKGKEETDFLGLFVKRREELVGVACLGSAICQAQ